MKTLDTLDTELRQFGDWFHNLHLPGGLETAPAHPLGDFPARHWKRAQACLPETMTGWRVLDVGCNAGYYSFALAARGAEVLGVDIDRRYLAQARWAVDKLDLPNRPRFRELSVYRLHELGERFDLVWFMGVAYHLRHPLLALDIIHSIAPRRLMFQTMTYPDAPGGELPADLGLDGRKRLAQPDWPKMAFIESRIAGDPTNWWVASDNCARALLRSSGFRVLRAPMPETYWCEWVEGYDAVDEELEAVLRHDPRH